MLGLAAIPAIIQFLGFLFIPESPRWLLGQNRDIQAMDVLQRIRGPEADIWPEYQSIKDGCKVEPGNILDVLRDKYLRQALLCGSMLQIIQQLTGINTVMYYSATIIQMSGVYDKSSAIWMSALTAMINFLSNFLGVYLVERIGRRPLTLASLAGVVVSLGILAIGFQLGASWMTLVGLCIYLFFFAPGMGPMPWTINSELYPLWCRSACFSATTSFNWFFNMLVSMTFLSLTRAITKHGVFWLYATFGTLGFIFFYFMLPETKGKSMEDPGE